MIMRIAKQLLALAFILFLACATGYSTMVVVQKEVSISRSLAGHVYVRGTNSPASGVTVELCGSGWKTVLTSTKTDEKGYFSLKKPRAGKLFYIRLSAPGMDIYQLRVRINKHAAQDLTVHLSVAT
jgi:hypothetical protein